MKFANTYANTPKVVNVARTIIESPASQHNNPITYHSNENALQTPLASNNFHAVLPDFEGKSLIYVA